MASLTTKMTEWVNSNWLNTTKIKQTTISFKTLANEFITKQKQKQNRLAKCISYENTQPVDVELCSMYGSHQSQLACFAIKSKH